MPNTPMIEHRDGYSDPYWEADGDDESDVCPHGKGFDENCWQCEEEQDEQEGIL